MRAAFLVFILMAAPAAAQTAAEGDAPVLAGVYACAGETEDARRLACYDAAVGRLRAAESAGEVVAIDRARAETIEREAFGFSLPSLPRIFGAGEAAPDAAAPQAPAQQRPAPIRAEINANQFEIARVSRSASGRAVFTMTNAQVWAQTDTENSRRAREGGRVTIRRAALGSYLMSVEAGGPAIRVRRQE